MGQNNKGRAVEFLKLAAAGRVREAFDAYAARNFRHHNAYFAGDAASLAKGMEENALEFPEKEFEVLRSLEDGDYVAVHARVRLEPNGQDIALIHIIRFEGDRIAEMWEAGQPVPENSPNENGAF